MLVSFLCGIETICRNPRRHQGLDTVIIVADTLVQPQSRASEPARLARRDARARGLAVDPLEQTRQDPTGADLIEGVKAGGQHPPDRVFPADPLKHLRDEPPDPSTIRSDVPTAWTAAIQKLLAKSVDQRFQTVKEFEATMADLPVEAVS